MTRRERLERKAERRREWADSRRRRSAAGFAKAKGIADMIPLGQPILVGHHSEKRHRRDVARIDSGMREGCESASMATHHDSKAAGIEAALERSIYSDDADALDALRSRIADLEASRARMVHLNKAIKHEQKTGLQDGWIDRIGATPEEARAMLSNAKYSHPIGDPRFPAYSRSNLSGNIGRQRKRLEHVAAQQKIAERANASESGVILDASTSANWCRVTFADKPARAILQALKDAGYRWGSGSWHGYLDKLPASVRELVTLPDPPPDPPAAAAQVAPAPEPEPEPVDDVTQGRTIWNSDGTEGLCLICPPPADRTLPDLAAVRDMENPDPPPVAELPAQTFELRSPEETQPTPGRLF